jgi:predicted TIM-barrel fold metal-dependent hydrolase
VKKKNITTLKGADESIPAGLVDMIKQRVSSSKLSIIAKAQSLSSEMPFNPAQKAEIDAYDAEIEQITERLTYGTDAVSCAMSTRSYHKMIRLAMVHAFTADNFTGQITLEGLKWAKQIVVDHSEAILNDIISKSGGDDALSKAIARITLALKTSGDKGMSHNTLRAKTRIREQMFNEALQIMLGDHTVTSYKTSKGNLAYRMKK